MGEESKAVKYEDLFKTKKDIENEPICLEEAAQMQRAETKAVGQTQKGGVAARMQSGADVNVREGVCKSRESK
ncbi:hypothetical protein SUGI_0193780 [Cryptomeria japonica]|nr:hypothetical protein SUGI_0193780 [Cryptomeria japonica]